MYLYKYILGRETDMDNILFVNEYNRTKDTTKETYQYWYFRRPLAVALLVFILFYLGACINNFVVYGYSDPLTTFLVVFILLFYPALYFIQLNAATKKDAQISHGNQLMLSFTFTPDRIYIGNTEGDYYLEFTQVRFAFETKNYVTLVTKSTRMMLIVHKNGFTTGDLDGFRAFLNEKKIKLRGQKK